jgi:hypothetical protein
VQIQISFDFFPSHASLLQPVKYPPHEAALFFLPAVILLVDFPLKRTVIFPAQASGLWFTRQVSIWFRFS